MHLPQPELKRFRSLANALFGKKLLALDNPVDFIPRGQECFLRAERAGCSISYRAAVDSECEPPFKAVRLSAQDFERLPQDNGPITFGPVESTEAGSRLMVTWNRIVIRHSIPSILSHRRHNRQ